MPLQWRTVFMLAILSTLAVAGCGDDPVDLPAENFSITVTVTTPDGDPVPGLRAAISPDVDDRYANWPYAASSAPLREGEVVHRIYDLENRLVCRQVLPSASHYFTWLGQNDAGDPVHDGVYHHVVDLPEGEEESPLVFDWLFVTGDPDHHTAGVTDAVGSFTVHDRTYVPAFYDLPPVPVFAYGELEPDYIEFEPRVRVTLVNDAGRHRVFFCDIRDGHQTIPLTWDLPTH